MNRFDSMTKEQYRAAKDGFFLQYNPPASKPVETMDLVMRQENALATPSSKETEKWSSDR